MNVFAFLCLSRLELIHDTPAFVPFAPSTASRPNSFSTLPLQKLTFVACNILTLGVGLWKCRSMGLLPTGTGDWLAFETRGLVCSSSVYYTREANHSTGSRDLSLLNKSCQP